MTEWSTWSSDLMNFHLSAFLKHETDLREGVETYETFFCP
jgi:hypothetical protein